MRIYQIRYPGASIKFIDSDKDFEVLSSIYDLESVFIDAAVSLNLFELQMQRDMAEMADSETRNKNWFKDRDRGIEIAKKIEAQFLSERKDINSYEQSLLIRELAAAEHQQEKLNAGVFPRSYQHRIKFIHAKSFVAALDMIGKLLTQLCKEYPTLPAAVTSQKDNFFKAFSQLKDIRDSLQHHEHRGRGLDRNGKPLDLQPGTKGGFQVGAGSLVLNHLHGNKFGTTVNNGQFVEIEISDQTIVIAQQCIQGLIDSFSWTGPASLRPS